MAYVTTASAAHAEEYAEQKSSWTASFSSQVSREDKSEADKIMNGSFRLQWVHDTLSIGATVGASRTAVKLPNVVEVVDTSSFNGGLNLGLSFGKSAIELDFGYSRQGLSGNVTAGTELSKATGNTSLALSGSVVSTSLGAAFIHTFGGEALTLTPRLAVNYGRTKTSARLTAGTRLPPIGGSISSDGVSIIPELNLGYAFSEKFNLNGSVSFTAATNGAASRLGSRPMGSGFVQTGQQNEGATQWGSLALSAKLSPFHNIAVTPFIGTTVGRSTNEYFVGTALSSSF